MVRRKDPVTNNEWQPTVNSILCSAHFSEDCFHTRGQQESRVRLKPHAVPTIFNFPAHLMKKQNQRQPPKVRIATDANIWKQTVSMRSIVYLLVVVMITLIL